MRENKEKQALGDLMIKPVQRIPRYELLVKVTLTFFILVFILSAVSNILFCFVCDTALLQMKTSFVTLYPQQVHHNGVILMIVCVCLLQDLLKHTPEEHPDYTFLLDAQKNIKRLAERINKGRRTAEELEKETRVMQEIEAHIEGVEHVRDTDFSMHTSCF